MADFNGADADDTLNGTGEDNRVFGGGGAETPVFETGRSGFVVTRPLRDVLVVSEASGLSAGNGTDVLSGVETLAFGSNVLSAGEASRVFAPPAGSGPPALPPGVERLLAEHEATGSWSPPGAGDGPEPEAPAAHDDGPQAVHASSGPSWEEVAARVQANFAATGHRYF